MKRILGTSLFACLLAPMAGMAQEEKPQLEIVWPPPGTVVELGTDAEKAIGVIVKSNFALLPAGQCGSNRQCGHVHMKIDPDGDTCNIPGRPYNSMNSDFGGDLIKARFGHCPQVSGEHVIGILLADDHHRPILVDGAPVTAHSSKLLPRLQPVRDIGKKRQAIPSPWFYGVSRHKMSWPRRLDFNSPRFTI